MFTFLKDRFNSKMMLEIRVYKGVTVSLCLQTQTCTAIPLAESLCDSIVTLEQLTLTSETVTS